MGLRLDVRPLHTVPERAAETTFEAWTVAATLARDTTQVNIGQMVSCNGYRHPSLFAKVASTVDVASHGRLYAGLGAGWYEQEWRAYGYPWRTLRDRMRAFAEAVEIVHRMWTEDAVAFSGRHYSVDRPINVPKGAGTRPQLWIGRGGQVTLRLVARYADGCNLGSGDPDLLRRKLSILRQHCDSNDTDYDVVHQRFPDPARSRHPGGRSEGARPVHCRRIPPERRRRDRRRQRASDRGRQPRSHNSSSASSPPVPTASSPTSRGPAYDHEPMQRFADDVIPHFA